MHPDTRDLQILAAPEPSRAVQAERSDVLVIEHLYLQRCLYGLKTCRPRFVGWTSVDSGAALPLWCWLLTPHERVLQCEAGTMRSRGGGG